VGRITAALWADAMSNRLEGLAIFARVKELDSQYPDPERTSPLGAVPGKTQLRAADPALADPAARHRRPREIGQIARAALVPV
jgi:hypothetical protein